MAYRLASVAQGELDSGVLAGGVAVVGGLAGHVILRCDHDVAASGRLGGPELDGRFGTLARVQGDDRGVGAERVVLRRQANRVLGGLVVFVFDHLVDDALVGLPAASTRLAASGRRHELDHPGDEIELLVALGDLALGRPVKSIELRDQGLAIARRAAQQILVHQVAGLPQKVGDGQVGYGRLVAGDEPRHRQGELAFVRAAGL